MACQKVCKKKGTDDIKVKVNIQSPIPTPFYTTVHSSVKKMYRNGALYIYLYFYIIPTLFRL